MNKTNTNPDVAKVIGELNGLRATHQLFKFANDVITKGPTNGINNDESRHHINIITRILEERVKRLGVRSSDVETLLKIFGEGFVESVDSVNPVKKIKIKSLGGGRLIMKIDLSRKMIGIDMAAIRSRGFYPVKWNDLEEHLKLLSEISLYALSSSEMSSEISAFLDDDTIYRMNKDIFIRNIIENVKMELPSEMQTDVFPDYASVGIDVGVDEAETEDNILIEFDIYVSPTTHTGNLLFDRLPDRRSIDEDEILNISSSSSSSIISH